MEIDDGMVVSRARYRFLKDQIKTLNILVAEQKNTIESLNEIIAAYIRRYEDE
jgi:uncharacterized coiled-coil protein SlyX